MIWVHSPVSSFLVITTMPYDNRRERFTLEATEPVWADSTWHVKEDIPEKGIPIEEELADDDIPSN